MENTITPPVSVARAMETGLAADEFDCIVREHQQRIYRVLMALLRDPEAAATLTQECFLRAYRNRASFRGAARVSTWLTQIAINLARDHRKNRRGQFWRALFGLDDAKQAGAHAMEAVDQRASPEAALLAREEMSAVWSLVDGLSPQQREIFLLRFAEELSLAEIAEALQLEVGTVKSHLARALGAVRKRIKEARHGTPPERC